MSKHLLKSTSGHLRLHSSGHLSVTLPSWHDVTETFTSYIKSSEQYDAYTRSSVDGSVDSIYSTVYSAVIAGMLSGSDFATVLIASIGGSYDVPGAPRASLWAGSIVCQFTKPDQTISGGRVYSSSFYNRGGNGGLFTAIPSAATLMASAMRSPVSNHIEFTSSEIETINNAADGATLYFILGVAPPSTPAVSYTQKSLQNEYATPQDYYGFTLDPGEWLYWKVGLMTFASMNTPMMSNLQFYY